MKAAGGTGNTDGAGTADRTRYPDFSGNTDGTGNAGDAGNTNGAGTSDAICSW